MDADAEILASMTRGCQILRQALLAEEDLLRSGAGPYDNDTRANLLGVVRMGLTNHWQRAANARGYYLGSGEREHFDTYLVNIRLGYDLLGTLKRERERTILGDAIEDAVKRAAQIWKGVIAGIEFAADLIPGWLKYGALALLAVYIYVRVKA